MKNLINRAIFGFAGRIWRRIQLYRYHLRIRNLIAKGLVLGKNVTIQYSAQIDDEYPYLIRIGNNCSISNEVRLLAHDATVFKFTGGHTRLGKIDIRDNCFVGERAIILPGVTIGPNALVVAGSVVNRDVPPNACVAGIPARFYARFDDFIERHEHQIKERQVFAYSDLVSNSNGRLREKVWQAAQDGDAYVEGYIGKYPHTLNGE
jgi:maltose O-acetyltransferase